MDSHLILKNCENGMYDDYIFHDRDFDIMADYTRTDARCCFTGIIFYTNGRHLSSFVQG